MKRHADDWLEPDDHKRRILDRLKQLSLQPLSDPVNKTGELPVEAVDQYANQSSMDIEDNADPNLIFIPDIDEFLQREDNEQQPLIDPKLLRLDADGNILGPVVSRVPKTQALKSHYFEEPSSSLVVYKPLSDVVLQTPLTQTTSMASSSTPDTQTTHSPTESGSKEEESEMEMD